MSTDYVSAAEFDSYLSDELGASGAPLRLSSLKAGHRAVNQYTKRWFGVASTATERVFPAPRGSVLDIPDCTTVTAVEVMGVTYAASLYQLEPLPQYWTGTAEPYNAIRLLGTEWPTRLPGEAIIAVTATWGWAAIPDEVVEATKIVAKDILEQRRVRGNMVAVGDLAGFVRKNRTAVDLLNPLRSKHAFAAVA